MLSLNNRSLTKPVWSKLIILGYMFESVFAIIAVNIFWSTFSSDIGLYEEQFSGSFPSLCNTEMTAKLCLAKFLFPVSY